jgi:hypothetical protein
VTNHVLEFEKSRRVMCNVIVQKKFSARCAGGELMNALRRNFSVRILRDRLRNSVTTFVVFSGGILISQACFAGFDLYAGGTLRSYPLAGVMEVESGYGILLRGEANSPFSSYLRPRLYASTAGIYNSADLAVEFFPLAIMGVRAGGEAIQNDSKYSAYDCDANECLGRYYRTYIEGELTLGAGPVFVQGRWRRERWTQKNPDQGDFIDPTSGVALKSQGDSQTVYYGVAGLKFSDRWTLLGIVRYSENDQLGGWSRFPYGVIRYKSGPFSVGVGAGVFESSLKSENVSALGLIRWEIAPSLALR